MFTLGRQVAPCALDWWYAQTDDAGEIKIGGEEDLDWKTAQARGSKQGLAARQRDEGVRWARREINVTYNEESQSLDSGTCVCSFLLYMQHYNP